MIMSDFYIGWGKGSKNSTRTTSKFFYAIVALMLIIVTVFTFLEKSFSSSYFGYGEQIELEGNLLQDPIIALRIQHDNGFEIVPLIGFGKMGPHAALTDLRIEENLKVKLRGTLISHEGRRFLELTDGKDAVISFVISDEMNLVPVSLGNKEIEGEIVDPKCFFGVMKPGFGKIHKSCAIRCISGQIPPVLAVKNGDDFVDFYLLTDMEGNLAKRELLSYVGKKITVKGKAYEMDDWKSLSLEQFTFSLNLKNVSTCGLVI
jgi:hypothetical protein